MLNITNYQGSKSHSVCLTLWDSVDYTVHGILQAGILEWVVVPFSRESSQPRDQTQVSCTEGGATFSAGDQLNHQGSPIIKEVQIKTTVIYQLTSVRKTIIKNSNNCW